MSSRPAVAVPGYEVEGCLGQGSIGSVFRAHTRTGGGAVALKWVPEAGDAAAVGCLRRDAEALAALDHPHVLPILDVIEVGAGLAVVMAFAPEGSLAQLVAREGALAWPTLARLAAGAADALEAAHRVGVLHCDLKPSNILLDAGRGALVSDFCLSRWLACVDGCGAAAGTAEYLDVAVARGRALDALGDVYSLGVVCYQALTGGLPFTGPDPASVMEAARRGRHPPIGGLVPGVDPDVAQVVERAMRRRPGDRPASAGEMARSFRAAAARRERAGAPEPEPMGAPARAGSRRRTPRSAASRPRPVVPTAPPAVGALVALALVLALGLGLAGAVAAGGTAPGRPRHRARALPAEPVAGGCGRSSPGPAVGDPQVVVGDVRGDGCVIAVTWAANIAEVDVDGSGPPARFRLGRPGDVLLLGDWRCAGRDVPALYRPSTGEVLIFSRWALAGERLAAQAVVRTGVRDGRPRRARSHPWACDRVVVERAGVGKHMRPRQSE